MLKEFRFQLLNLSPLKRTRGINMKLTLLPLDSRPCTYNIPRQLAECCAVQVNQPPADIMDYYKESSDFEAISQWLYDHSACDDMVISIDQLVYGGLLASRSMTVDTESACKRLAVIQKIKLRHREIKIRIYNVIMRTTVSTLEKADQIWWELVAEYSQVCTCHDNQESIRRRHQLETVIPPQVLAAFLAARRRNHQVNMEAVKLVALGAAEELILLQEDSAPNGMHKAEQTALLDLAKKLGIAHKVYLHCGTDEAAAALVGKVISLQGESQKYLGLEWLGGEKKEFTARYEDRPFSENLTAYLQTCQVTPVSPDAAKTVMVIYAPKKEQQDLAIHSALAKVSYTTEELEMFCDRIAALLQAGKQVALLDIHYANGGEGVFIQLLSRKGLLHLLTGYAGWNTACNSLGTLLGQLLCLPWADPSQNRAFTCLRLLDDWLYQAVVRRQLNDRLKEIGEDDWNIQNKAAADVLLNQLMHHAPELKMLGKILEPIGDFQARLEWPRTFECSVLFKNEGETI